MGVATITPGRKGGVSGGGYKMWISLYYIKRRFNQFDTMGFTKNISHSVQIFLKLRLV